VRKWNNGRGLIDRVDLEIGHYHTYSTLPGFAKSMARRIFSFISRMVASLLFLARTMTNATLSW
jgi:hypothetical protein